MGHAIKDLGTDDGCRELRRYLARAQSALHDATSSQHLGVVQVPLDAGARCDVPGDDGRTAVDEARASGDPALLAHFAACRR